MNEDISYSISEIFTAPQGEGLWAGTLMTFIRFAGCNVGKPFDDKVRSELGLQVYQDRCETWDGYSFACDTNYRPSAKMSLEGILKAIPTGIQRVCLTGGEPLLQQKLLALCVPLWHKRIFTHLETSGTHALPFWLTDDSQGWAYIAVSPKLGCKPEVLFAAHEIKLLVGQSFHEHCLAPGGAFASFLHKIFLQPINHEHTLAMENVQRCLELQRQFPYVRLSIQLHKVLGTK